jgi:acetolactate synthase-1/2/3 large subunit
MGFELPAAIGAQLAKPGRQVLSVSGDGSFLQTMQELAAAAMLDVPVCQVILDNSGWISIKGGQEAFFGRTAVTDFTRRGEVYSPDFEAIGSAFGLHSEHVTDPRDVCPAVKRALASGGPSVVAISVDRDLDRAGPDKTGWWDVPVSESQPDSRAQQLAGRAEEQQL